MKPRWPEFRIIYFTYVEILFIFFTIIPYGRFSTRSLNSIYPGSLIEKWSVKTFFFSNCLSYTDDTNGTWRRRTRAQTAKRCGREIFIFLNFFYRKHRPDARCGHRVRDDIRAARVCLRRGTCPFILIRVNDSITVIGPADVLETQTDGRGRGEGGLDS